jgi:hypothetical protein
VQLIRLVAHRVEHLLHDLRLHGLRQQRRAEARRSMWREAKRHGSERPSLWPARLPRP